MPERDSQHFLRRRHFEVQRHRQRRHQRGDILVANVPPVLAQMGGDAVCARLGGQQRRFDRVGMRSPARVANGRHMIDVDAQAQMSGGSRHYYCFRLPGLIAGIAASAPTLR